MSDLEARIRRLEDRAELEDLVIRYFVAADDDDMDTLGAAFAEDAEFVIGGGFSGGSSRAAIVDFIRGDRKNMGVTVHTQNFTLLTFGDDDHASGVIGAHLELARGGTTVYGAVRYLDDYVRTAEGWKIKRREMATVHVGPWDDVATSLTSELRSRWPGQEPAPADLPR
ncbi:nuclear transport factor 2 family protein [Streptomyces sp. NPDC058001]|uniref:nuclear transport factor 2 family protein n=1 Tax=Streptomyces sp. NPDC058001 TaxID=3346300 RepID=UPI0036F075F5